MAQSADRPSPQDPPPQLGEHTSPLLHGIQQQLLAHYAPPALVLDSQLAIHHFQGDVAAFTESEAGQSVAPCRRVVRQELREPLHWMVASLLESERTSSERTSSEPSEPTSTTSLYVSPVGNLSTGLNSSANTRLRPTLHPNGNLSLQQLIQFSHPYQMFRAVVRPLPRQLHAEPLFLVCMESVALVLDDRPVGAPTPSSSAESGAPVLVSTELPPVPLRYQRPMESPSPLSGLGDPVQLRLEAEPMNAAARPEHTHVPLVESRLVAGAPSQGEPLAVEETPLEWESASTEGLLTTIVNSSPDMIFIKDRRHRMQFVNESFARNLGHPAGFFLGKTDLEMGLPEKLVLGDPDDGWPGYWAHDAHVFHTGETITIPADPVWIDGAIRIFHTVKLPVRDSLGRVRGLLGYARDITERTEAERKTRETATRLRAILEGVVDGVLTLDEQGCVETFNLAAERIFGYEAEDVIGMPLSTLVPESRQDNALQRLLTQGERGALGPGRELVGRRKNGERFPMELALSETILPDKRLVTGIVRDITRRKDSERELTRARDLAEQASRAKSEFLSQMSHELRTPLNAILGFAQLMEADRGQPLSPRQRENNQQVLKAGWHLLELINEILDLAKIEAGKVELSMETVDVGDVVSLCEEMILPMASQRGIRLVSGLSPDVRLMVWSDQTRLRQMLLNLLSNAVKYNRDNGSVLVTAQLVSPGRVRILVRDTGMGIPPEDMARLFQPFVRLGSHQQREDGTGIGLVITRRLAELMGGSVGVESQPGVGSTFWIELETGKDSARALATGPRGTELNSTRRPLLRIPVALYVEDNLANYELLRQLLEQYSALQLIRAANGREGLSLARSHRPDLIILDIGLPDMDGYEVLRRLQADPDTCNIPVFALSANALPADVTRGLNAGFRHYFTKPLQLNVFLRELGGLLKNRDGQGLGDGA